MYKLILSDLDETLLVNHHVPIENVQAIKKAREKGIKFVPATGRAFNMIPQILDEIDAYDKEGEFSICFNGALIVENKDNRILNFNGISFEQTNKLFKLSKNYDVCVLIFTMDMCYIYNANSDEVERKTAQKAPFKVMEVDNIDFLKGDKIAKILYEKKDVVYLKSIENDLQKDIEKLKVCASYSSNRYLEFNTLGIDKGFGLRWLANYLDIDTEDTIAIGDNYNDEKMIQAAGLGVCVTCAADDLKAQADYVTKHDYDQGAVKEVIEKYVL
ncbi:Cof-type HAD-IIB family hydrolase [Clostridium vincentii]|uniref:Sugar phosphatase YidA n=1 Tax=Clostridium vincentii TaxID=52704 RepID=A0A2T0BFS1_9CLOT|nr:Cof-type HAD-IIB family hydrolase [Clostridium vincentii]PRR82756.1 Sugar phosphatase YidA [Clostridium vincentii]